MDEFSNVKSRIITLSLIMLINRQLPVGMSWNKYLKIETKPLAFVTKENIIKFISSEYQLESKK